MDHNPDANSQIISLAFLDAKQPQVSYCNYSNLAVAYNIAMFFCCEEHRQQIILA